MKPPVFQENWPEDVKALHRHDMEEIWDPSLLPHIYNYYQDELRRYQKIAGPTPKRILDVGVAQATLALLLAEQGHSVTAMDIRPAFLEYAKTRYEKGDIQFLAGNILEEDLDLPPFDLVFANQLIEHLVQPLELVKKLHGVIAPGGQVVVTTPSAEYIMSDLPTFTELGDTSKYMDRQFFADGDGHFFAYTKEELATLMREAGFTNVVVMRYASPWISGHMKIRFLHRRMPVSLLRVLDRILLNIPGLRRLLAYQLMATGVKGKEE